MLLADFYETTVSQRVSERANQLAATAHGLMYGYLEPASPYLELEPDPDRAGQLWKVRATYGHGTDARRVELAGGFHPDVSPLQLGPATASCSCTGHQFHRVCAHVIATWRRALLDHQPALVEVSA